MGITLIYKTIYVGHKETLWSKHPRSEIKVPEEYYDGLGCYCSVSLWRDGCKDRSLHSNPSSQSPMNKTQDESGTAGRPCGRAHLIASRS